MSKSSGCFIIVVLLLAGCATTGDPRQGGLFGWDKNKAQKRIEELQLRRNNEENIAYTTQGESKRLTAQEYKLKTEYNNQRQRLNEMQTKLSRAEKNLKNTRQLSKAKEKEKTAAEQQLAKVKHELEKINTLSEKEIAHKRAKITELNEELEALIEVIANL